MPLRAWLARSSSHRRHNDRSHSRKHQLARRRIIESLEDRRVLATIMVTSLADNVEIDGQVTLREAIQAANSDAVVDGSTAGSGADAIVFADGLAGTIVLGGTQLPTISDDLTISGPGAELLTIDGDGRSRVLRIAPGVTAEVAQLTISGGNATGSFPENSGGGIYNDHGSLTLTGTTVRGNSTSGAGPVGGGVSTTAVTAAAQR